MTDPNAAMAEAWGGDMGHRWVRFSADLEVQHRGILDLLMDRASLRPGERVLDIGCGAGAASRAAARDIGAAGRVTGLDISEPLLTLARAEAATNTSFRHDDAQVAVLERGAFDVAISRFGVMFFDDPVAAFGNIRHALRSGGRIVFVAWGPGEANPWFTAPRRAAIARCGTVPGGDPDAPGPLAFRDPDKVCPILEDAGFELPEVERIDTHLHQPEGWDAVARLLPAIGPIPSILRETGGTEADLTAILADLKSEWDAYLGPDGLRLPAQVLVYSAMVPG